MRTSSSPCFSFPFFDLAAFLYTSSHHGVASNEPCPRPPEVLLLTAVRGLALPPFCKAAPCPSHPCFCKCAAGSNVIPSQWNTRAKTLSQCESLFFAQWQLGQAMTSYLSPLAAKAIPRSLHDSVKRLLVGTLSLGPLPQHVSFVMDGNRRYARESGLHVSRGHADGFKALGGVRSKASAALEHG